MRKAISLSALAMGSLLTAQAGAALAAPAAQTLAFKGAALGMSLQDWKALPFPVRTAVAASPVCTGDPGAARLGMAVSAAELRAGVIGCTYVYGPADAAGPRRPVPLNDHILADHVLYKFRGGRLISVSYRASVDAFDDIVARLEDQAGPPTAVQRDTVASPFGERLPRVRMSWRTASGSVLLTDPADPLNRLSVTLTLAPAPAPAGAPAARS